MLGFNRVYMSSTPTEGDYRRLAKRMTPSVRDSAAEGLLELAQGLEEGGNKVKIYKGVIAFAVAAAYGEQGVQAIDWSRPPELGNSEQRYLVVLQNLARAIGQGDFDTTRQILNGASAFNGSRADSGGTPIHPELLVTVGSVSKGLQQLLTEHKLQPRDVAGRRRLSRGIDEVVGAYREQQVDRSVLATSVLDFHLVIDQRLQGDIPLEEQIYNNIAWALGRTQ